MIFATDSGLELALTYLVASAAVGAVVALCIIFLPGRPLPRTVGSGIFLGVAALLFVASVGAMIEYRLRFEAPASAWLGLQWPSWVTAFLLAFLGAFLLRPSSNIPSLLLDRLNRRQVLGVAVIVLLATAIAMFMLPVLDWHYGWNGYHGHTYPDRGFHFH
ncbi:MAG: hypothetical protein Rubg2KO_22240 [Rubricoccaceae bacterium]